MAPEGIDTVAQCGEPKPVEPNVQQVSKDAEKKQIEGIIEQKHDQGQGRKLAKQKGEHACRDDEKKQTEGIIEQKDGQAHGHKPAEQKGEHEHNDANGKDTQDLTDTQKKSDQESDGQLVAHGNQIDKGDKGLNQSLPGIFSLNDDFLGEIFSRLDRVSLRKLVAAGHDMLHRARCRSQQHTASPFLGAVLLYNGKFSRVITFSDRRRDT